MQRISFKNTVTTPQQTKQTKQDLLIDSLSTNLNGKTTTQVVEFCTSELALISRIVNFKGNLNEFKKSLDLSSLNNGKYDNLVALFSNRNSSSVFNLGLGYQNITKNAAKYTQALVLILDAVGHNEKLPVEVTSNIKLVINEANKCYRSDYVKNVNVKNNNDALTITLGQKNGDMGERYQLNIQLLKNNPNHSLLCQGNSENNPSNIILLNNSLANALRTDNYSALRNIVKHLPATITLTDDAAAQEITQSSIDLLHASSGLLFFARSTQNGTGRDLHLIRDQLANYVINLMLQLLNHKNIERFIDPLTYLKDLSSSSVRINSWFDKIISTSEWCNNNYNEFGLPPLFQPLFKHGIFTPELFLYLFGELIPKKNLEEFFTSTEDYLWVAAIRKFAFLHPMLRLSLKLHPNLQAPEQEAENGLEVHDHAQQTKPLVIAWLTTQTIIVDNNAYLELNKEFFDFAETEKEREVIEQFKKFLVSDSDLLNHFKKILVLIQQDHPECLELYFKQFITESAKAYNNSISCDLGIKDRLYSGLRSIFTEVDEIYKQHESTLIFTTAINHFCANPEELFKDYNGELLSEQDYRDLWISKMNEIRYDYKFDEEQTESFNQLIIQNSKFIQLNINYFPTDNNEIVSIVNNYISSETDSVSKNSENLDQSFRAGFKKYISDCKFIFSSNNTFDQMITSSSTLIKQCLERKHQFNQLISEISAATNLDQVNVSISKIINYYIADGIVDIKILKNKVLNDVINPLLKNNNKLVDNNYATISETIKNIISLRLSVDKQKLHKWKAHILLSCYQVSKSKSQRTTYALFKNDQENKFKEISLEAKCMHPFTHNEDILSNEIKIIRKLVGFKM